MRISSLGLKLGLGLVVALSSAGFAAREASAQGADGRLFYEIVVTDAGTRSQGWHGIIYSPDGSALAADPGVSVETRIGVFEAHACTNRWTPCGFIRADGLSQASPPSFAVLNDPVGWGFRLFVVAEGSRSEGWRGELRHGDALVPAVDGADPIETQMGRFVSLGQADHMWSWSGWMPETWVSAILDPK